MQSAGTTAIGSPNARLHHGRKVLRVNTPAQSKEQLHHQATSIKSHRECAVVFVVKKMMQFFPFASK